MGIVNVGIVSVGIDIPNLSCVVLSRPTKLISVYLQCVGRVTRLFSGKVHGIVIDHAGIIEKIGLPTDRFEWSLDGKESVEARAQKSKEEKKEPKQITCSKCHCVFVSRRSCPDCGHEIVPKGEPIPTHKADLVEVTKPKPADKSRWYSELLGYAKSHGKSDSFALAMFRSKFAEWPKKKHGVIPFPPSAEVLGYIKHSQIKYAKRKA